WNFTRWAVTGPGVAIAAKGFPFTYLEVQGTASTSSVAAVYAHSASTANLTIYVIGDGTATVGPLTLTNSNNPFGFVNASMIVPVGTYSASLTLGSDSNAWAIYYGPSLVILNNSQNTLATLENGTGPFEGIFEAVFTAAAPVKFLATPSTGGQAFLGAGGPLMPITS